MLGLHGRQRTMSRGSTTRWSVEFRLELSLFLSSMQSIVSPQQKQAVPTIVENFPLLQRTHEDLENIRLITERRRIENVEKKLRRQILKDSTTGAAIDQSHPSVRSDIDRLLIVYLIRFEAA